MLTGRFKYLGRLTEKVKVMPPFSIDQVFNVENFRNKISELADSDPKKKRISKFKTTKLKIIAIE
jgi:hypothetical protein